MTWPTPGSSSRSKLQNWWNSSNSRMDPEAWVVVDSVDSCRSFSRRHCLLRRDSRDPASEDEACGWGPEGPASQSPPLASLSSSAGPGKRVPAWVSWWGGLIEGGCVVLWQWWQCCASHLHCQGDAATAAPHLIMACREGATTTTPPCTHSNNTTTTQHALIYCHSPGIKTGASLS